MSLRAVFLDVGNTLLFEEPSRFAIYAEAARTRDAQIDDDQMQALMRRANDELPAEIDGAYRYSDAWFQHYLDSIFCGHLGLDPGELEPIAGELFGRFEDARTFHLFPGALELLAGLREHGLALGVVSNWSARLPRLLDALDLTRHFDFIVCSAIERTEKPEPAIFEAALQRAGVAGNEALHAGDDPRRDGAARELGIEFVLVDHHDARADSEHTRVRDLAALGEHVAARLTNGRSEA